MRVAIAVLCALLSTGAAWLCVTTIDVKTGAIARELPFALVD